MKVSIERMEWCFYNIYKPTYNRSVAYRIGQWFVMCACVFVSILEKLTTPVKGEEE
jgi:hypothetical protein